MLGVDVVHNAQAHSRVRARLGRGAIEKHVRVVFLLALKPARQLILIHGPVERVEVPVHGRVGKPLLKMLQVMSGEQIGIQGHVHVGVPCKKQCSRICCASGTYII